MILTISATQPLHPHAGYSQITSLHIYFFQKQVSLYAYPVGHHGLRGSASPALTATGFVSGRWQFSTPHRIHTPLPITKKFGTGNYVGGPYGCAKFGANSLMGASGQMGDI